MECKSSHKLEVICESLTVPIPPLLRYLCVCIVTAKGRWTFPYFRWSKLQFRSIAQLNRRYKERVELSVVQMKGTKGEVELSSSYDVGGAMDQDHAEGDKRTRWVECNYKVRNYIL